MNPGLKTSTAIVKKTGPRINPGAEESECRSPLIEATSKKGWMSGSLGAVAISLTRCRQLEGLLTVILIELFFERSDCPAFEVSIDA